jgi:HK97 family phage prohead protease
MQNKLFGGSVVTDATLGDRQIRVVANSGKSDRVQDVLVAMGCKLDNYLSNNIVLADHNAQCPIGNFAPEIKDDRVEGIITFAPAGASSKADEYCALYKAGVMKTVSVGFREIAGEPIKGGGWLYKEWELMELSCVAVPCDPGAVVTARSLPEAGRSNWKCGASLNLPIAEKSDWDAVEAAEHIFAKAGFDGDNPDVAWARKGFLAYDDANPKLKSSYKLPFADVIDGRLTAIKDATDADDMVGAEVPSDVMKKAHAVLNDYEARMKDGTNAPASKTKAAAPKIKGLYDVAWLAQLLCELGYIQDMSVWEAECEQDGSKVPAMLAAALQSLADAFLAMTAEETAELLAGRDVEVIPVDLASDDSLTDATKRMRTAFRKAGRMLSAENAKCLEKAMDCMSKAASHIETACSHVKDIQDRADSSDGSGESGDSDELADVELASKIEHRKRMVMALALAPAP